MYPRKIAKHESETFLGQRYVGVTSDLKQASYKKSKAGIFDRQLKLWTGQLAGVT